MKIYKLAFTYGDDDGKEGSCTVRATDSQVIRQLNDDLAKALQKELPKSRIELNLSGAILGDGGWYRLSVSNLKARESDAGYGVATWIERWLCEHEWEPFAIDNHNLYFRQESII